MHIQVDLWAALLVMVSVIPCYLLFQWRRRFAEPSIAFPDISNRFDQATLPKKVSWINFPRALLWIALVLFAIAFINPEVFIRRAANEREPPKVAPREGVAIYLILDQSGSMREEVFSGGEKGTQLTTKIDLVKQVTRRFVEGRPNDMIGLLYFARGATVAAPLTLDHQAILSLLSKFNPVKDRDQDGTSIGYAIYKGANLMAATRNYAIENPQEAPYAIKSNIMILLTDGLQDPNPLDRGKRLRNMDIPEAAAFAKEFGIKLYIINVEPKLADMKYAPNRNIMQRAAESTGGKFYMVGEGSSLVDIYSEIDGLEKSLLAAPPSDSAYKRVELYPYIIALALFSLLVSVVLEGTVFRRVP